MGSAARASMPRTPTRSVALSLGWVVLVALGRTWAIRFDDWYEALVKPGMMPPEWMGGVAWALILMGAGAAAVAASEAPLADRFIRRRLVGLYVLNGLLNVGYTWLFFRLQRPDIAVWAMALLLFSVIAMLATIRPLSRTGALLLTPYLLWVVYGVGVMAAVVRMN